MRWKSSTAAACALLLTLATGCSTASLSITPTQTTETRIAADVCSVWLPVSYSASQDTAETVLRVRAGNAARDAYCKND
jgi:hypothetical protein